MWTPRRLLLVVFGLALFTGGFTLYASLFGWIDGLPPLPEVFTHQVIDGRGGIPELPGGVSPLLSRMRLAFGQDCIEQSYKLKFESREKGLLFAAAESDILPDGRVKLTQVSVAIFGKTNRDMTTVHSDEAFLTFDFPVRRIDDMGSRKVTAAEMHANAEAHTSDPRKGKVLIVNNRKTPDPDDDVIFRTPGPLYYVDEPKPGDPNIWTFQSVELFDRQNRPLPSQPESRLELPTVTGDGMRVFLIPTPPASAAPAPPAKAKPEHKATGSVNGVDHIEIEHNVFMNLWTGQRNMFGSEPGKSAPPKSADLKQEDKVLVTIQTNGPFSYDMIKEIAHFEVPPKSDPGIQEYVKVTRHSIGNQEDTLTSDFLDVQFRRRRPATETKAADPKLAKTEVAVKSPASAKVEAAADETAPDDDLDIETVHAWGTGIALSSDQDALFAFGQDLFYDARISQTVLKGKPMHAVKSGNLIRAPELLLANLDDPEKQSMRAPGPGIVGMGDFDPKTQEHSRQAHFQDLLVVTKVKEQGKVLDFITLQGKAKFIDTVNSQSLSGRVLKLWMLGKEPDHDQKQPGKKDAGLPMLKTAEANAKVDATANGNAGWPKDPSHVAAAPKKSPAPKAKDEPKQAPHRLEAIGDVMLNSPDLVILRSEYLNVWFKDVPPPPPPALPDAPPAQSPAATAKSEPKAVETPQLKKEGTPKKDPVAKKDEAEKKGPPLIVRHARRIEAWVNRIDGINDLDKVHNEGNVIIHQDPSQDNETGVDIAGHTVDVEHFSEGNYLAVEGNEQNLGEVQGNGILIIADDIKIDQRDNTATVKGPGSMRLRSKTTLDGTELETPSYIDIFWNDAMELDGPIRSVRYEGSVQAKQNDAKVLCETMQVWLDRPLYLNQASKPKAPAPKDGPDDKAPTQLKPDGSAIARRNDAKEARPTQAVPVKRGLDDNRTNAPKKPTPKKKAQDDDSPKVEKVLCDQLPPNPMGIRPKRLLQVSAEDSQALGGKLIKFQHTLGTQIEMDNVLNKMTTIGPGTVRIFQAGTKDPAPAPQGKENGKLPIKAKDNNRAKSKNPDEEEMKLTWVAFDRRMIAFNTDPKRAVFYNNIELVHMPSDRHDVPINVAKLPPSALHLTCSEMLEISTLTRKAIDRDGTEIEIKWQEMKATGNVRVRNEDCEGWARVVTFSEEKSLLVFTGTLANPAVLNKAEQVGGERKTFRGEKITYNTKTKDFGVEGSVGGAN